MKITLVSAAMLSAGLLAAAICNAQAPAGSTGECKDGTYTTADSKRGACSGHGGVKDWYDTKPAAKAAPAPATAPAAKAAPAPMAAPAAPAAAPAKTAAPMTPAAPAAKATSTAMPTAAAAGGGPGQVWVNTKSKVYHCPGDKYYGKTKEGAYMTESAAKAAGDHADHGKACS